MGGAKSCVWGEGLGELFGGCTWRGHRKYRKSPLTPVLEYMLAVPAVVKDRMASLPCGGQHGIGRGPQQGSCIVTGGKPRPAPPPLPYGTDTHSHLCLAQWQATATYNGAGEGQLERVGQMDSADRPDAEGVGFRGAGAGGRLGGRTTPAGSRAGQQRAASVQGLRPVSRPSAWFVHTTSEAFGP